MSETTIDDKRTEPFHWWFLPSWLGLDAPCVVSLWTYATSRAAHLCLPLRPIAALFLTVWFIYLSDRLIDVHRCRDWTMATGRLRFGRDFRRLFVACQALCVAGLLALVWLGLPPDVIQRAAFVALGVGFHCLAFVTPVIFGVKLPGKEFGVGLFFAFGAYACLGVLERTLPFLVSIAVVVSFNCLVIAARDAASDRANDPGGASRWWRTIHRDLLWLGAALTVAAALLPILTHETAFYLPLAAAFAALTLLHVVARRLSGDGVRALADFALLAPMMGLITTGHEPFGTRANLPPPPALASHTAASPSSKRDGSMIILQPSGHRFVVPADWLGWYKELGNNFHLTGAELDRVGTGAGEWDDEYARVCNVLFPFDRCAAHVGGEGWGRESVGYGDLQVRVYDLDKSFELPARASLGTIEKSIAGSVTIEESEKDGWRQVVFSYWRFYGDYGATAHVDIRLKQVESGLIAFVFMHADRPWHEATIHEMLASFRANAGAR